MNQNLETNTDAVSDVLNPSGLSNIVLVCEHASSFIPASLNDLGLSQDARFSHAAWDPGALAVAKEMSGLLDAPLVVSNISRLVYDCNRPPDAADAMPDQSEIFEIPGNKGLSEADRKNRVATYYAPFKEKLEGALAARTDPTLVTIHSFTPIYNSLRRDVEVGILHDKDARLADAMLKIGETHTQPALRRNEPYGPEDGVTHTLKEHALRQGRRNAMIEVRNDLIETDEMQQTMARMLANWVADAVKLTDAYSCTV